MIVNVKVTQETIDTGEPCNSFGCPIVIAVRNALGTAGRIEVTDTTIIVMADGINQFFITPWTVTEFVHAFDAGEPVEPFEFKIEVNE